MAKAKGLDLALVKIQGCMDERRKESSDVSSFSPLE